MPNAFKFVVLLASVFAFFNCGGGPVVWTVEVPCDPGAAAAGIAKAGPNIAVAGTKISPKTGALAVVVQMFDDRGQIRWRREYTEGETNVAGDVALNRRGEAFVAGGAQIYAEALPVADRIFLTRVHAQPEGETLFPAWEESRWQEVSREDHPADDRNEHDYTFCVLERR